MITDHVILSFRKVIIRLNAFTFQLKSDVLKRNVSLASTVGHVLLKNRKIYYILCINDMLCLKTSIF